MNRIEQLQKSHPELTEEGARMLCFAIYHSLNTENDLSPMSREFQGLMDKETKRLCQLDRDVVLGAEKELTKMR